ncbi:lignin-forming anionic peroxidase-like [Rhododendron vialii]|uniref:lignin-forming anionic peroxidase-like n=1 Tax=Rhododendron vialii TaxID=182163 RepID=UPI00265E27F7|nr:lignin-forming anionic peroxidase-like [Rhododendron vialii]
MNSPTNVSRTFYLAIASALLLFSLLMSMPTNAQLSSTFYDNTCPNALNTIRTSIRQAVSRERRMAASLIRLHFHDCFVQGCDASILLSEAATSTSEWTEAPNADSTRGYEVIDAAKAKVEKICPEVVSCADILAVVKLGRKDSTTASRDLANSDLPFFRSNVNQLIANFARKGLSARDMVALSGAHTIGQAQCFTFSDRINSNGSDIDASFASTHTRGCRNANLAPLDLVTPNSFDNNYFKNLIQKKGLLESDQTLFSGGPTDNIVSQYSRNPSTLI